MSPQQTLGLERVRHALLALQLPIYVSNPRSSENLVVEDIEDLSQGRYTHMSRRRVLVYYSGVYGALASRRKHPGVTKFETCFRDADFDTALEMILAEIAGWQEASHD